MKKAKSIELEDLSATKKFAEDLCKSLGPGVLLLLNGDMGTGKTQLVRYLLECLGESGVTSPTFSLHNIYETNGILFHHFDLYRMESDEDLERSGFFESLNDLDSCVVIEWSDRLVGESWYPKAWNVIQVDLKKGDTDGSRIATLSGALHLD